MRWSEAFGEWVNGFMGEWVNGFMGLWGRTQHAHAARLFPSTHSRERSEQTSRASASKHPIHPFTHSPIHPFTIFLLRIILLLSAFILLPHCAGSKPALPAFGPPAPTVAAGLDSAVVARSDALAESLFVSWERQEAAQLQRQTGQQQQEISDALWQALGNAADSSMTATADTVQAIGKFNQGAQQLLALQQLQQTGGDPVQLRARSQAHLDSARIYREGDLAHCPILGGPYQIYYFWTIVDNVSNDTLYQSNETLIGANVDQANIGDRLYVLNDPPELAFDRSFTIHFATRCVPSDGSPDQFLTNSWMGNFAPKGLYPEDNSTELTAFLFSFEVELYGRWVYGR